MRPIVARVNELEVPHRGKVKWMAPCQTPSPTLQAAIAKLFALVGLSE